MQGSFILLCVDPCCIITSPLSVFSQLSLEARGIATTGMQNVFAWWNRADIEDKDAELIVIFDTNS